MRISKLVEIRDDVLKGEVLGWIRLRGIFENARTRVELLLSLTLEHKMTELKRRLGYVAIKRS